MDIDPKILAEIHGDQLQDGQTQKLDQAETGWLVKISGGRLSGRQANLIQYLLIIFLVVASIWISRGTLQTGEESSILSSEIIPNQ